MNFSGDIRIIGPRPSGKMIYLATLAYFPHQGERNNPIKTIKSLNDSAIELTQIARDVLAQGGLLEPMDYIGDPKDNELYCLFIDIQQKLNLFNLFNSQDFRLQIAIRPYAGEFFSTLSEGKIDNYRVSNHIDDLATVRQIILLIDAVDRPAKRDREYARGLETLEQELNSRLSSTDKESYRIAVVFSKFDQSQAWISRHNLEDFSNRKFPRTKSAMAKWSQSWDCSVAYFACSAFGMVGNPPRPNTTRGNFGALADPQNWQPFGLVSPIYWLCTGKRDPRLDNA